MKSPLGIATVWFTVPWLQPFVEDRGKNEATETFQAGKNDNQT